MSSQASVSESSTLEEYKEDVAERVEGKKEAGAPREQRKTRLYRRLLQTLQMEIPEPMIEDSGFQHG